MELRVIVGIIYFSLIAIGIAWMCWFLPKDRRRRLWVHLKTENLYRPVRRCRIKNPTTGEWVDAVIYIRGEGVYVREETDFLLNFKQLEQWEKNGNDSKQRVSEAGRQTS